MSRDLCQLVYVFINKGSFSKDYGLRNQVNNSSGSAMDNIAEGFERGGRKEFIQFLGIAKASAGEVRSQLYRALDRDYINQAEFDKATNLAKQVSNTVQGLISYLNTTEIQGIKYKVEEDEVLYEHNNFKL